MQMKGFELFYIYRPDFSNNNKPEFILEESINSEKGK
jgi:hypothetical protein